MERGHGMKKSWMFIGGIFLMVSSIFLCLSAQASGPKVDTGSAVQLTYFLDANGVSVVSEQKKEIMRLVVGKGSYPPAFEKQLIGLKKGDSRKIQLKPEQGYGPYNAQLVRRVPKEQLPSSMKLQEGMMLGSKDGRRSMRIAKILDDSVVLDENHPLAGKTLNYHVQVTNIQ